jgi:serine/threonine protein kinase
MNQYLLNGITLLSLEAAKYDIHPKTPVVLKFIIKSKIAIDGWVRDRAVDVVPLEIQILDYLRDFGHTNIAQMTSAFYDTKNFIVEMPLHGSGLDLFDYIELNQLISEQDVKVVFRQVCDAVQHLHGHKIVHRGKFSQDSQR